MAQYAYRARDSALKILEGTIEAENEAAAINQLGGRGVFALSIMEVAGGRGGRRTFGRRRIFGRQLAQTTRQLADLLGGGLPLLSALTLLARQTDHPTLRRVIEALTAAVREGRSLSDALADHPTVFSPLYINMVKAGEVGGGLEQALARLAELGENEAELRSRLLTASAYPLFVLAVAVAMTIFLLAYVIPTLSQVFVESGQLLPLPTRVLLAISETFTRWWVALGGGLLLLVFGFGRWRLSAAGRAVLDPLVLALPGVGALARKLETARFMRNLGVMIGQGVPVLQALEVVAHSVSNTVLRRAVVQVQESVRDGSSIAVALSHSGEFPPFVSNMVTVGEESGTVDAALLKVAGTYEREVDRAIKALTTIVEPILLVGVGGVVMFIVLAMLLPVFQIGLVVQ